jgi:hypothetical protein
LLYLNGDGGSIALENAHLFALHRAATVLIHVLLRIGYVGPVADITDDECILAPFREHRGVHTKGDSLSTQHVVDVVVCGIHAVVGIGSVVVVVIYQILQFVYRVFIVDFQEV